MRTCPSVALSLLSALALAACASGDHDAAAAATTDPALGPAADDPIWSSADDGKEDTSASAYVRQIDWDGFVIVPVGADDATVQTAIARQVKSALGALLHQPQISLRDRDARSNLDPKGFTRQTLKVLAEDGTSTGSVDRVTYHYRDRALVPKAFTRTSFSFVALFDNYAVRASELIPPCSDDPGVEPDSLWFHYDPTRSTCRTAIANDASAIDEATAALPAGEPAIAAVDVARRFLTVRAQISKVTASPTTWPELDQLFGFGTERGKLVVYSFFGVDADDKNPHDWGIVEDLRYVRTLRAVYPELAVVETTPQVFLLDFTVDGQPVAGVTYEDVAAWVLDGKRWPAAAPDTAKRDALLQQVRDKFAERWIVWQVPVKATRGNETRPMTIELRTYWGREDGQTDWRQAARNRYLEAFWNADVFTYTGHSHFGHGPLEPVEYSGGNFPDRYQVMLFNSCVSYNYYDIDFLEMHPGGPSHLDVVGNGLPAYWPGMGEATAKFVLGLIDGQDRSWSDVLTGMRVTQPGLPANYEPMRAVTGEEENRFNPAQGKVTVQIGGR